MVWFKVDDKFHRGKKVRRLGASDHSDVDRQFEALAALGLWLLSGDWSADEGTDGFVPNEVVSGWDPVGRLRPRLVGVDLWEESEQDGEKGILFHDWQDWQPTSEKIEKKRADQRRRVAEFRAREKLKIGNAVSNDASNALRNAADTMDPNPNPKGEGPVGRDLEDRSGLLSSSPREKKTRGATAKKGTRIPDDFTVTEAMVAWARDKAPSVDGRRETEQFMNYWQAATGRTATKQDWVAAWRYWMGEAEKRHAERSGSRSRPGQFFAPDDKLRGWQALKNQGQRAIEEGR